MIERRIRDLLGEGDDLSVADMFELQILLNQLSQLREMSSSVTDAANRAIAAMARNVKS